jgi:hypothetical protein
MGPSGELPPERPTPQPARDSVHQEAHASGDARINRPPGICTCTIRTVCGGLSQAPTCGSVRIRGWPRSAVSRPGGSSAGTS